MKINLQIDQLFSMLLREKDFMVSSGFEEKFQINQGLFFFVLWRWCSLFKEYKILSTGLKHDSALGFLRKN